MATNPRRGRHPRRQRKNYRIDVTRLRRAQRILGTRTETETIHKAFDLVVEEAALMVALRNFMRRGAGHIDDIHAWR
jgi:Arc/MetJ family transcription regulator